MQIDCRIAREVAEFVAAGGRSSCVNSVLGVCWPAAAILGLQLKHREKNVCDKRYALRGDARMQNKMSHCRATDSMAVSVLPNVAIILPDPKAVLAIRQVLKLESAKACEIKACAQDLSQSKT